MTDFPISRPGQFRVKLEELSPSLVAFYADTLCLIWSGEHGAWWRAGCAGYTTSHAAAGRYTLAAAYAATNHCDPSKAIAFEKIDQGQIEENVAVEGPFQQRVQPWLMACFGEMIAGDREERNHRFLEESLELVQACGCTASEAHQLVDYVFGRQVGEPAQEVGGVMVTLAALCLANNLDLHAAAETELARVWTKVDAIRAKQAAKPKHSPLPEAAASQQPADQEGAQDRFWLIVREPGIVPDRKGPWPHRDTAKVLREFIAARPRAFLDVLTIDADGVPWVEHGPQALQIADGRSMSVGRKHNARVQAAAEEALTASPRSPATDQAGEGA